MVDFLPLDGLGGRKYGRTARDSAGKLQPITGRGYSTTHLSIAGTFAAMTMTGKVSPGGVANIDASFEKLVMVGYGGATLAMALPTLTMTGHATTRERGELVMTFPALTMTGQGQVGAVGTATMVFQRMTMTGQSGWSVGGGAGAGNGVLAFPAMTMEGSGRTEEQGSLVASFRPMRMTGNGLRYSEVGSLVASFQALRAADRGSLVMAFQPMQMYASQAVMALTEGWALNVRNGAVTRLTCWPFSQFARVSGKTFAVGDGGLYVLGGDTLGDAVTPIPWVFETGRSDLGSPAIKHVPYLYMDAIIEGDIEVTLIDDRGREYRYKYKGALGPVHAPHRRKLGNAIRTRNVALRIASPKGAYAEFDALEPEVNLTQRSLG